MNEEMKFVYVLTSAGNHIYGVYTSLKLAETDRIKFEKNNQKEGYVDCRVFISKQLLIDT